MENQKISTCRTCLGPLDVSRNLCDVDYKNLLDLLQRILSCEVQIKAGVFAICQNCEEKLKWVLEFKSVCEKSLEKIKNADCKEEYIDIDDYNLCLENNDFEYETDHSNSDSDFNIVEPKKRKKDVKRTSTVTNKLRSKKPVDDSKWKRCRSKQYSPSQVLQAIAESTTYFTDVKNRTCIHCEYVATTAKMLSIHMHTKHWDFLKTWCNRCNIQTEILNEHKSTIKCCEDRCKFCNKKCGRINRLTEHLRTHCHELFKKPNENAEFEWDSNLLLQFSQNDNTAHSDVATSNDNKNSTTLWLKTDSEEVKNDKNELDNENDQSEKENLHQYRKHTSPQESDDEDGPSQPKRVRKNRLEQFPHEEVEKAIKESMRSFHTNRQCIICGKITKNSKFLSGHMTKLHRNKRENWCSRCNTLVENLTEHKLSHRNDLLKCTFCERGFNTIVHLKEHLKAHSRSYGLKIETNWFSCKHCPESFSSNKELRGHSCESKKSRTTVTRKTRSNKRIIESSEDESECSNAGEGSGKSRLKQFSPDEVQQAINDSMKSFHENRKCILCGFLASHSRTLSFHMSKVHKNIFHRWCSRCNTSVDNLAEHKDGHKNDILKCKFCEKGFSKIVHLKDHLKCHSRSYTLDTLPKFYNCKECPNTYTSEKELKEHVCKGPGPQTQSEKKFIRPAVCIICKMRVKNLRIHVKHKHKPKNDGPTKKLCSVCGKTCSTNYDLAMHMRTHTGELPHKCSYCDKRFLQRTSLLVHEKRHLGEKPHVCHVCGKAFVTTGDLRRHEEIHEGGPEQCPVCDKQFCRPGVLKLHMKRHTGENPFSCIDCGLSFHRRSLLQLHIKKHSNERPFKCTFCEKDFKHRQELKDHERIHKGIKPYKCSQCSYTCGKSYSLTLHMKQHPEDAPQASRPHKCLFCYKQFSTNAMLMSHTNNKHRDNANEEV